MAVSRIHMVIAKNDKAIATGIVGVLIFLLGWYAGRIMSPYYASTPIVFEDRTCAACPASSGSLQDLLETPAGTKTPDAPISEPITQSKGLYVASRNSNLFHHYTCASAKSIKPENQIWYATYEEATASGKTPSSCTQKLGNSLK